MLPDDNEIMIALQKDDEAMFEKVFRHYYNMLCAYASGIIEDYDEAEDIVQQTMVKIWEKRSDIEISNSLKSYLYRSVHNAALNRKKHSNVRKLYADDYKSRNNVVSEATSIKVIQSELEKAIADSINKLPEQCRLVFKLSRFEDLKYSEIAEHLGISIKTVENQISKALRMLRSDLHDYIK